jgi:hypothetical protein
MLLLNATDRPSVQADDNGDQCSMLGHWRPVAHVARGICDTTATHIKHTFTATILNNIAMQCRLLLYGRHRGTEDRRHLTIKCAHCAQLACVLVKLALLVDTRKPWT